MGARPNSSMRLRMRTLVLAMRLSGGAATVCTSIVHIMSPASWLFGITCRVENQLIGVWKQNLRFVCTSIVRIVTPASWLLGITCA